MHTQLEIEAVNNGGVHRVFVRGELGVENCEQFAAALREVEASGASSILLDIDGLTFIDSTGLRELLKAKRRSDSDRRHLRLTRGTGDVARIFQLTGLARTLSFEGDDDAR